MLTELFRREGFRWAEHHVAGVVDDDIETTGIGDDVGDGGVGRCVGLHVQLDAAQIDLLVGGPTGERSNLRRVCTYARGWHTGRYARACSRGANCYST